jgi:hypothetical protein
VREKGAATTCKARPPPNPSDRVQPSEQASITAALRQGRFRRPLLLPPLNPDEKIDDGFDRRRV